MSKYIIYQNEHRATPKKIGLYLKSNFKWRVAFDRTAIYDIGERDQGDINKLCGIRYLFGDYSARFGWRYNPQHPNMVQIMAYVHDNGKVTKGDDEVVLDLIPIGQPAILSLSVKKNEYIFTLNGKNTPVPKTTNQKLSFKQNLYFGGDQTAPHNIEVNLTSL